MHKDARLRGKKSMIIDDFPCTAMSGKPGDAYNTTFALN